MRKIYLLALSDGTVSEAIHAGAREAFAVYASGIERALSSSGSALIAGNITLADICFAAEIALFNNELPRAQRLAERGLGRILHAGVGEEYPLMTTHFARLAEHEHFKPDLAPYLQKLRLATDGPQSVQSAALS